MVLLQLKFLFSYHGELIHEVRSHRDWAQSPLRFTGCGEIFPGAGGNDAALMSPQLCSHPSLCSCVFLSISGPGKHRRSTAELEGHRNRHGGDPGCDVSGHPLSRPPHTW